jgi:hypothetical protein
MLHHKNVNSRIEGLDRLSRAELRVLWEHELGDKPPRTLGRDILALAIAYTRQVKREGGLSRPVAKELDRLTARVLGNGMTDVNEVRRPSRLRVGTILVREWRGVTHYVTVVDHGFLWKTKTYGSLSSIASAITGTHWNGPRFFGLRGQKKNLAEERHES